MGTITVIGTGYLGATHAAAMAQLGHEVIGIDTDKAKVASLMEGAAPFYEPGLDDLIAKHLASGHLRFTTDFSEGAAAQFHFICVGTPQKRGSGAADLTHVDAAVAAIGPHLQPGSLVVGKSTVPVGTAARLAAEVFQLSDGMAHLAWNPEFLREGFAVEDTLQPDRIVVGVADPADADQLAGLYAQQVASGTPFLVTDFATAELVKVAANSFLATKISFINAMADVCEAAGADVSALATAIGHDDRIGPKFLRAGVGFGGGCLPKDIRAFMARGEELGIGRSLAFLREVDRINMQRRNQVVEFAEALMHGSVLGARIAVLGVAFKPDSDDIRDSPALNIAAALHLKGAQVSVYDPKAMGNAAKVFPTLTYVKDHEEALRGAHLTLLLTEWQEFQELDPEQAGELVENRTILDGRNVLDKAAWRRAGWTYRGIGIT
jgi:UDPglucose 6-dehydrogenase